MTETCYISARHESVLQALEDGVERAHVERQLPAYLRQQRWFGGQTRQLTAVRIDRWVSLPPAAAGGVLCHLTVADATGFITEHLLPLRAGEAAGGRRPLEDALQAGEIRVALLALALEGGRLDGHRAELAFEPTDALPPGEYGSGRLVGVEQSNTSIVYGAKAILKFYRRIAPGRNPDVELARYLTTASSFNAVPRVLASATLRDQAGYTADALLVQEFIPNHGDGWSWALERAGAAYAGGANAQDLADWLSTEGETQWGARELGAITGELHLALAAATSPSMAPEAGDTRAVAAWVRAVREEAARAAAAIDVAGLDRPRLRAALERARALDVAVTGAPGQLIRVHGDYHLGQVLRARDRFVVLDFEGEPAKSLEERRARQHPLVDVAGMLRSWSYAAHAAATASRAGPPNEVVQRWGALTRASFLAAYWGTIGAAPAGFMPANTDDREALLALFELRKALYELRYELDYRPDWVPIPAAAIERNALVGSTKQ